MFFRFIPSKFRVVLDEVYSVRPPRKTSASSHTRVAANLQFSTIQENDFPAVLEHLRAFFFREEPLMKMLKVTESGCNVELEAMTVKQLEEGLSIKAVDGSSKVVAVAVLTDDSDSIDGQHDHTDPRLQKACLFIKRLYQGLDLKRQFQVETWLGIQALSVDPGCRGQGIGVRLMAQVHGTARRRSFGGLKAECTAVESQAILARLGYTSVTELPYADFPDGKAPWFAPQPPNFKCILMVKLTSTLQP